MRNTSEGLLLTLFLGIPSDVWYAFWLVTAHASDVYVNAFLALYHLEIVTIAGDPDPIEVVRPSEDYLFWWVEMSVFILTPSAACLDGCPQSTLP